MNNPIVKIEKAAYGGQGIAFIDKKIIFINNAVPGDCVEIEIYKDKKDYAFANISKIIEPSEKRIEPECEIFGICGGCSYLNMSYEDELIIKKDIIIDSLIRIGKLSKELIPEISTIHSHRFNYRSHASFKINNSRRGFFKKDSNDFIPLSAKGCHLLQKDLNNSIELLYDIEELRVAADYKKQLFSNLKDEFFLEKEENLIFKRDINSFFQANRFLRSKMVQRIKELSELTKDDSFIDIGCGIGFFTLYLASISKNGTGFDINKDNIKFARMNAIENNINNIKFVPSSASDIHPARYTPKTVIVDPPRPGIMKKARNTIISMEPEIIVYVSCNPATYSRDIKHFLSNGYVLKELDFIDMFPGTHHIEIISKLRKV